MATRTVSNSGGTRAWSDTASWVEAAVPTAADDVVATGTSGALTIDSGAVCRSVNLTGYTNTVTHNAGATLTIGDATAGAGNVALSFPASGWTYTLGDVATSAISFISTSATAQTVRFGGKTTGNITFNAASGGSWQYLSGHLTGATALVTLTKGSLDLNGQTVTWGRFDGSNANTRTLTISSSTINIIGTSWTLATTTGLTFFFNLSTIAVSTNLGHTFQGGGLTYYAASFNKQNSSHVMTGANTFTNLTVTDSLGAASGSFAFPAGLTTTITGTLTITGFSVGRPLFTIANGNLGSVATVSCTNAPVLTSVVFRDITATGAGGAWAGTQIGDAGGLTNITTTAPRTLYWVAFSGGSASATTSWSTSSGGASGANPPLPQDASIINALSITSGARTITWDISYFGSVNFTGVLNNPSWAWTVSPKQIFGSVTLVAAGSMTISFAAITASFQGRGSYVLTTAGQTWGNGMTISILGGTLTLADNLTANSSWGLTAGTLDAATYNVNVTVSGLGIQASSTTYTKAILMGSGTWTMTGTGNVWAMPTTTLTLTPGTSTLVISDTSATAKSVSPGNLAHNNISVTGAAGTVTFGNMAVVNLTFGSGAGGYVLNGSWNFSGVWTITGATTITMIASGQISCTASAVIKVVSSAGNLVTFVSSVPGTFWTINKTNGMLNLDWVSLTDSHATGGAGFYAGANSTNGGGNTGWLFTQMPWGTIKSQFVRQAVNRAAVV